MGNVVFDINGNVNLNKNVDWQINKNVVANVEIEDKLATAQADAEAFGVFAFAETDAFATVNDEFASSYSEATAGLDVGVADQNFAFRIVTDDVTTYEWDEGGPGNGVNSPFVSRHGVRGPVLADDFTPAVSGDITLVEWWGSAPITPDNQDEFEITIHDNVDPLTGEPDQTLPSGGIAQVILPVQGFDPDGDGVYQYSLSVDDSSPLNIFLNAGQSYWFSVANSNCLEFGPEPGPGCLDGWTWADAGGIAPTVGSENFTAVSSIGVGPNGGPHFGPWDQIT